ncbi:unnamed protein product [Meloidogyne enterolobii]|uniref:Uncharacterized protein n=1 Tax=Meloidogyne enterolobii TaxID=390850 RepID=A0ACB0YZR6_MELEN
MCEQKYKFFKPEPRLYEFELGEELEKKWKDGIEKKVPMFLASNNTDVNTVVFELERNYETEKALYYFQLSKYPKNIEEMKIARYFFQLLFNCSFHVFKIRHVIINQQMIEILFANEIARNVPLQIHSQGTFLHTYERFFVEFMWNHLVTNHFFIVFNESFDLEQNIDIIFKILTCGGDKFIEVSFEYLNSNLYNIIIEVCAFLEIEGPLSNGSLFSISY